MMMAVCNMQDNISCLVELWTHLRVGVPTPLYNLDEFKRHLVQWWPLSINCYFLKRVDKKYEQQRSSERRIGSERALIKLA